MSVSCGLAQGHGVGTLCLLTYKSPLASVLVFTISSCWSLALHLGLFMGPCPQEQPPPSHSDLKKNSPPSATYVRDTPPSRAASSRCEGPQALHWQLALCEAVLQPTLRLGRGPVSTAAATPGCESPRLSGRKLLLPKAQGERKTQIASLLFQPVLGEDRAEHRAWKPHLPTFRIRLSQ